MSGVVIVSVVLLAAALGVIVPVVVFASLAGWVASTVQALRDERGSEPKSGPVRAARPKRALRRWPSPVSLKIVSR